MAGFPPDLNNDEMKRVCETCSDLDPQPVTIMAALLRTEDQVFIFTSLLCVQSCSSTVYCLCAYSSIIDTALCNAGMQSRVCETVECPFVCLSVRPSVCPIVWQQERHAAGLLLSAPLAGDIASTQQQQHSSKCRQYCVDEAEHRLVLLPFVWRYKNYT